MPGPVPRVVRAAHGGPSFLRGFFQRRDDAPQVHATPAIFKQKATPRLHDFLTVPGTENLFMRSTALPVVLGHFNGHRRFKISPRGCEGAVICFLAIAGHGKSIDDSEVPSCAAAGADKAIWRTNTDAG